MALTAGICNSFKKEVMQGVHTIETDIFKIALYSEGATLSPDTTEYDPAGETVGQGYAAGGQELTGAVLDLDGNTAIATFNNATWLNATIDTIGALIYNSSKDNKAVAVIDFGSEISSTNGDFSVQFPAFDRNNAIIRLT